MKTLDELKAENLPRCRAADFAEAKNADTDAARAAMAALDEYVSHFLPDRDDCPMCGATIQADPKLGVLGSLMSSFTWGLTHGEGFCGACKYPIRLYHFPPEAVGVKRFVAMLCYHPSELATRPLDAARGA